MPSKTVTSRPEPVATRQGPGRERKRESCPNCAARLSRKARREGEQAGLAPPIVHEVLREAGQPLDAATRAAMEPRFRHDFSHVRIHSGERAARSAEAVDALAYTVGSHIVLGAGQRPAVGELLAHELVHVMQAGDGPIPSKLPVASHDSPAEREASDLATRGHSLPTISKPSATGVQRYPFILTERRRRASGSVNPGPGIRVSWSGQRANVSARLQVSGGEATVAVTNTIQATINNIWNASFADGYAISTTVNASHRGPGQSEDGNATQIEVFRGTRDSFVRRYWVVGARHMRLNINNGLDWTPAHEFGHLLGLPDQYSEGIASRVRGLWGGRREATVNPGYAGNIMAVDHGRFESKNVRDLIDLYAWENVPVGMPSRAEPEMA